MELKVKKITGDEFTLSPLPPRKKKRKKNTTATTTFPGGHHSDNTNTSTRQHRNGGNVWGGGGGEKNESYRKKQKVIELAKTFATYCMLEILNSSHKDGVNIRICKFVNLPYI